MRILRESTDYKLIEHTGGTDLSLMYIRYPYIDGEFCCGTAELSKSGQWTVLTAAPMHADVHLIREVATVSNKSSAIELLWQQRLWMHWTYLA